jgi:omega-amidase
VTLRVALGQYDVGWQDPDASLARAAAVVRRAADAGARLVVLPEMAPTGFTMDARAHAEPLAGPSGRRLADVAREAGVWLLSGIATCAPGGAGGSAYYNSAALHTPDGSLAAEYRKQKLFAYAGEHESYAPGDGPVVAEVEGVRLSPFVCYDLRFPELFRAVAPRVDLVCVIANWPASRQAHWDALVRARAIENQCWVVAVNRIGRGGRLDYGGGSAAYDPWGEPALLARDADAAERALVVEVDPTRVEAVRGEYPFLKDM